MTDLEGAVPGPLRLVDRDQREGPSQTESPPGRLERRARWVAAALMLQMAVAMLVAASQDSPVFDDTTHVAAGILNVRERDLRWNAEHPPLVKVLAGLATAGADVWIPRNLPAYRAGDEVALAKPFLYGYGNDGNHLVWLARLPMIGLTLLFALVVYGFARDLFGTTGALLALALFSLCPTVLAHGRSVHTDVAVAGFLLATAWFLWRAASRGRGWFAAACAAFGLALLTKFNALLAVPAVAAMAFWSGWRAAPPGARRYRAGALRAAGILAAGVAIVWAGYLAVSPSLRFETAFYEPWARRAGGLTAAVIDRLPFPRPYRVGLRFATAFDQAGQRSAFLLGESYAGGKPAFYPVVLALKTPLGSLALWAAGLLTVAGRARRPGALLALLAIPATVFGFAMASSTNIGIRHVAVVPVFAAVTAGAVSARLRDRRWSAVVLALVAFTAVSVWRVFPSQISYANEIAGGPSNAYRLMADSNVDWGQDLGRLARAVRAGSVPAPRWLLYFGTADPASYGIHARDALSAPREEIHGTIAVSISWLNLRPATWGWIERDGTLRGRVGDSILIYEVP